MPPRRRNTQVQGSMTCPSTYSQRFACCREPHTQSARTASLKGLNGPLLPQNTLEKVGGEAPRLFQWVAGAGHTLAPRMAGAPTIFELRVYRGPGYSRSTGYTRAPGIPGPRVCQGPGYRVHPWLGSTGLCNTQYMKTGVSGQLLEPKTDQSNAKLLPKLLRIDPTIAPNWEGVLQRTSNSTHDSWAS